MQDGRNGLISLSNREKKHMVTYTWKCRGIPKEQLQMKGQVGNLRRWIDISCPETGTLHSTQMSLS
jgi:hypothetical protein